MTMNKNNFRLPLACEGSTLSYFLSMCEHRPISHFAQSSRGVVSVRRLNLDAPVFVVGCPRSGTTIVGSCLAAHSAFGIGGESLFMLEMSRVFYGLHQGVNRRGFRPLESFLSADELLRAIRLFADRIYDSRLIYSERRRVVDHTPWYVGLIPFIDLLYPTSIFVHIVRDGRDVACSLEKSFARGFPWAGKNLEERVQLWTSLVGLGLEYGDELTPSRYTVVTYENLCAHPKETLLDLVRRLGYEWEEGVLIPLATPLAGPSRENAILGQLKQDGRIDIRPRMIGNQWPAAWTHQDRSVFMRTAGDLMERLGYNLG